MEKLQKGKPIYAKTHAEFLNKVFGTNYKAWMKCVWRYKNDPSWIVWMVRFNKEDGGWRNTFVADSRIKQENLNGATIYDGMPIDLAVLGDKKRIVIQIVDGDFSRKYIFKGKYIYDEKASDPYGDIFFDRVSDEL